MITYIFRRILLIVPTLFIIVTLVFGMLYLVPGDPAEIFLGEHHVTPELLTQVRHDMGLDRPISTQYFSYIGRLMQGNLGTTLFTNQPVSAAIAERIPYTVQLALAALVIALIVGISSGIAAAILHNTWIDSTSMLVALVGISMPIFWSAILLIILFSIKLHWFPATGQGGIERLVLPALSLGMLSAGVLARITRSSMLEALGQDYVRTALSKGVSHWAMIFRHAIKNAMIPIITMLGLQIGQLLSGAVITETIFARRGLGRFYINAILNKDIPVIQSLTLLVAMVYVVINLLVDVSYGFVDPRIRYD